MSDCNHVGMTQDLAHGKFGNCGMAHDVYCCLGLVGKCGIATLLVASPDSGRVVAHQGNQVFIYYL